MSKARSTSINSEEWTIIRDFGVDENGDESPRYTAKYADDIDKRFIEPELVFIKEEDPRMGERIYQLPKDVFEEVAYRLPSTAE